MGNIALAIHGVVKGMEAFVYEQVLTAAGGDAVRPFREDAADLIAMFQTSDAGTPEWHRARARALFRDAQCRPLCSVTEAWRRLATRHIATALLLEQQNAAPVDRVARGERFSRHN